MSAEVLDFLAADQLFSLFLLFFLSLLCYDLQLKSFLLFLVSSSYYGLERYRQHFIWMHRLGLNGLLLRMKVRRQRV